MPARKPNTTRRNCDVPQKYSRRRYRALTCRPTSLTSRVSGRWNSLNLSPVPQVDRSIMEAKVVCALISSEQAEPPECLLDRRDPFLAGTDSPWARCRARRDRTAPCSAAARRSQARSRAAEKSTSVFPDRWHVVGLVAAPRTDVAAGAYIVDHLCEFSFFFSAQVSIWHTASGVPCRGKRVHCTPSYLSPALSRTGATAAAHLSRVRDAHNAGHTDYASCAAVTFSTESDWAGGRRHGSSKTRLGLQVGNRRK